MSRERRPPGLIGRYCAPTLHGCNGERDRCRPELDWEAALQSLSRRGRPCRHWDI